MPPIECATYGANMADPGRAPGESRLGAHRGGTHRLAAYLFGEPRLERRELAAGLEAVVARMGKFDRDIALDAAGARGHHHHAAGHEYRLVDVVGDEQDGLAVLFPDTEQ